MFSTKLFQILMIIIGSFIIHVIITTLLIFPERKNFPGRYTELTEMNPNGKS
jgi:hypothetical protein